MDISCEQAHQALEDCQTDFVRFVPVDELLFQLEIKRIITENQKTNIKICPYRDKKAEKLLHILKESQSADDFKTFCQLLQNRSVTSVQEFGKKLLDKARSSTG